MFVRKHLLHLCFQGSEIVKEENDALKVDYNMANKNLDATRKAREDQHEIIKNLEDHVSEIEHQNHILAVEKDHAIATLPDKTESRKRSMGSVCETRFSGEMKL